MTSLLCCYISISFLLLLFQIWYVIQLPLTTTTTTTHTHKIRNLNHYSISFDYVVSLYIPSPAVLYYVRMNFVIFFFQIFFGSNWKTKLLSWLMFFFFSPSSSNSSYIYIYTPHILRQPSRFYCNTSTSKIKRKIRQLLLLQGAVCVIAFSTRYVSSDYIIWRSARLFAFTNTHTHIFNNM